MINEVSPSSLSAFNKPDSGIQLLANNQELANARLLSGAVGNNQSLQNNTYLSTALLLHQLLNARPFSSLGGFPASVLLSPSLLQFLSINNLTVNFFYRDRHTVSLPHRYAAYQRLIGQLQKNQTGQGVPTIKFFT